MQDGIQRFLPKLRYGTRAGIGDGVICLSGRRVRLVIRQALHQSGRALAIHHAVVLFLEQRILAVSQSLDEPDFPQGPVAIQVLAVEVRDDFYQCIAIPGGGQGNPADVVVQVEILVLHPVGQVEPERYLVQPPVELGNFFDTLRGQLPVFFKTEIRAVAGVKQ